ncbi:DNA polymerase IV [Azospirillum sp. TSH100]|uniref:DNA polymerase IV n=1 Tax=Azospirillum sp. TSH100 TaxID=652764 RepID=UPI000D6099AF|nr:DNA polymerase IV [Azospirillum sp. TSH100]PWC73799.1 DNA polymerase IV [Azospirillum sp. TSH100]QCG91329.1 DNA polymerase IV [Azospirillum sp. TSH100]
MNAPPHSVCRDCAAAPPSAGSGEVTRCPKCGSRRLFRHAELHSLPIGHIDCDSFYATVEKRDRPELASRPVIVGGDDHRGVVAACCYVARMSGVRSAMTIREALDRCPDATIIRPNIAKYKEVGHQARAIMEAFTPLVEPISIDEAYLDLTGVEDRLSISPAQALVEIVRRFERELRITASIGLSYNKLLAKIASDLDKPRGFSALGRAEAAAFLAPKRVTILWGVGPALERKLFADGITRVGDLQDKEEHWLVKRYGAMGRVLYSYARGEDSRRVHPESPSKSISSEETFDWDVTTLPALAQELRPLAGKVARRLEREGLLGRSVVLKLKTKDFQQLTRSRRVEPTRSAEAILAAGIALLEREVDGRAFRLIGIGCTDLTHPETAPDPELDLFG